MIQPYRDPYPMETIKKNVVFVRLAANGHQHMAYVEFSDVEKINIDEVGTLSLKDDKGRFIIAFAAGQWHSFSRNRKVEW